MSTKFPRVVAALAGIAALGLTACGNPGATPSTGSAVAPAVTELTVVTQDYHLPRAVAICRQVGVDAVVVPDTTVRGRYPAVWAKGAGREWAANLKMEWDLATGRQPQADPFDPSLLAASQP